MSAGKMPQGKTPPGKMPQGKTPPGGGTPQSERPCPICRKPAVEKYRPFCSKRCADVDLNRWLSGAYAIPGRPEEDEDGESGPPERE